MIVGLEFNGKFKTWYYFWYLMYNRKQSVIVERFCMNTLKDKNYLEESWNMGKAPWTA